MVRCCWGIWVLLVIIRSSQTSCATWLVRVSLVIFPELFEESEQTHWTIR